jgi:G6PDH family F420-dependent oxidoreductase
MTEFGYTAMCEQTPVRQLVTDLVAAEAAGFGFSVMSDHYFPWIEEQGHAGYAWSVLGAAAQATSVLPLMTFVTCPSFRYHPAVVAQQAATMGVLSGGRFTLGLGAGERLNEHVIGGGWPSARTRHERLDEAAMIIRKLFHGGYVNFRGRHFQVDHARLFDLPENPVPIGIAVSGPESIEVAASHGDAMIATEPDGSLVDKFRKAAGKDRPRYGQLPLCWGPDEAACQARARELWRWALPGWHVMAELPDERSFAAATEHVTEADMAGLVPCGPDTARHVEAARSWVEAGFTHLALVQVGAENQAGFIRWAEQELLPELRKLG